MRTNRQAHGALQLDTPEARPVFEGETLVDMRPDGRNRAKDLIEDLMIAVNGNHEIFYQVFGPVPTIWAHVHQGFTLKNRACLRGVELQRAMSLPVRPHGFCD